MSLLVILPQNMTKLCVSLPNFCAVLNQILQLTEVAGDVIFGMAVDYFGRMYVHNVVIKQWANYLTLWPAGPVLCTFEQHLVGFCSQLETASDVI